ncbi:MAG: SDR family NAD(P)-dependent oxidoreductase, partial [Candidatus Cloacimonadaceae bacterium]
MENTVHSYLAKYVKFILAVTKASHTIPLEVLFVFIKPTFYNHSIIITGASQGIGSHLALQLSRQGANLTLAARNAEKLARVVKLCNKNGGKAIAVT